MPVGRPPRDREAELERAEEALFETLEAPHKVRKLDGSEADLLHRTFGSAPGSYDDWEFESH